MRQQVFLAVSAVAEAVFGLFMLAAPAMMLSVFLGYEAPATGMLLAGRAFGATLVTLALAGWFARQKWGPRIEQRLAIGVVVYDVIASTTLVLVGFVLGQTGVGLWPAVIAHSILGVWGALDLRQARAST